jgi:hypothetical protein
MVVDVVVNYGVSVGSALLNLCEAVGYALRRFVVK